MKNKKYNEVIFNDDQMYQIKKGLRNEILNI